jgi:hypothetical protein
MGDEDRLLAELKFLGIDETTVELLALLPLVAVAWADGEIQVEERALIHDIARDRYHLSADGLILLDGWLNHAPSPAYVERGRRALLALARTKPDFKVTPDKLVDVVEFSKQVAKSAGGFLGFRSITKEESLALEDIAAALHVHGHDAGAVLGLDEDVEDEDTTIREGDEMQRIREGAHIAASPTDRSVAQALGDLVHHGPDGAANFPMDLNGLTIGRSRACDVQIAHDAQVSRLHCRVLVAEGRFWLEDNGTTNGTWVNGERVKKRRLYGGEQIRVGDAHFTFLGR